MSFRTWTDRQKAEYILSKLQESDISPALLTQIQGWLLSGDTQPEKERLLNDLFEEIFDQKIGNRTPRAYRMLEAYKSRMEREKRPVARRIPLRRRRLFQAAAVLIPLAVVAGTLLLWVGRTSVAEPVTAFSAGDAPRKIRLADGTRVWMNEHTRLRCAKDFTDKRAVTLEGEAYFEVTPDTRHPFTVRAGDLAVTVLGTTFDLKAYPEDAETTVSLFEGRVQVEDPRQDITILDPQQRLTYNKKTGKSEVARFDPADPPRWMKKSVTLEDASLGKVLEAVGEFYRVRIVDESALPETQVTMEINEDFTLDETLQVIQFMIKGFRYEIDGDTVRIF